MARRLSSSLNGQTKAGLILATTLMVMMSSADAGSQKDQLVLVGPPQKSVNHPVARGLIRSNAKTEIRTELRAPISQTPLKSGEQFERGDKLISFDCERYEAELKAAKASEAAAWIEYSTKKRLLSYNAIGKDEVRLASAKASKASAETKVRKVIHSDCTIKAPFSGRVVELTSSVGEYPTGDKPLMVILDDRNLEIEILVPSVWLNWLKVGQKISFEIDETGKSVTARLSRLGAEIDPVSRTIKVFAQMEKHSELIIAGMSGQAIFAGDS